MVKKNAQNVQIYEVTHDRSKVIQLVLTGYGFFDLFLLLLLNYKENI